MADTGAPWNIPYIEPSDLVRNYPAANEVMADAIAAGLTAAGNPGIGSNVVSAFKNDTFSTASTTFVDVTNLEVTITPTSATSKILVLVATVVSASAGNNDARVRILRDATVIASNNQANPSFGGWNAFNDGDRRWNSPGLAFLDSPATTSAVVYKMQVKVNAGTAFINRRGIDNTLGGSSTLTVIEVAP